MYADANDYTYPSTTERILVQSNNWPGDVTRQLLDQQVENIRLEESNAWLEGEVGELKNEIASLKAKISAIGRNLARAINRLDELENLRSSTESVKSINPSNP